MTDDRLEIIEMWECQTSYEGQHPYIPEDGGDLQEKCSFICSSSRTTLEHQDQNCHGEDAKQVEMVRLEQVIDWIKEHRKSANKDYGQAAEEGTQIEQSFEAGYASAFDKLLQELGESPKPDNDEESGSDTKPSGGEQ